MKKRTSKKTLSKTRYKTTKVQEHEVESELEHKLVTTLLSSNFPSFKTQFIFHPTRKWRFDVAWPNKKVAIEIQGFGPTHNSMQGMYNDCEKHNAAIELGWKLLYFMSPHLTTDSLTQTLTCIGSLLNVKLHHPIGKPKDLDPIETLRRAINQERG